MWFGLDYVVICLSVDVFWCVILSWGNDVWDFFNCGMLELMFFIFFVKRLIFMMLYIYKENWILF